MALSRPIVVGQSFGGLHGAFDRRAQLVSAERSIEVQWSEVPLLLVPLLLAFVVLLAIALLPLSLVQRYRVGSARRPARGWFVTLNLAAILISIAIFLVGAAITTAWVPNAFSYTLIGLATGCLLGIVGLALTRWERTARALLYTPNRWLVLLVTLLVTARVLYGFWRSWHAWSAGLDSWSTAFGIAGSMGAGAVVLGYYLAYWAGVRRRMNRHYAAIARSR